VFLGATILSTSLVLLNKKLQFFEVIDTQEVKIGNSRLFAEVASNEEERRKGLSGRTSLSKDGGLLFLFEQNVVPSFWMKDMLIPIDIIWINDWRVVKIHENVQPEPNKPDGELTKYVPDDPIDYVLEVNAGFARKNNIKVGDNVIIYR